MSRDGSSGDPRRLIASWRARPPEPVAGPPLLPVPEASAVEVITAVRRLVRPGPPSVRPRPAPRPELLRLATALVVDEHPSAPAWSATDRETVAEWVAVLIEYRGEDGVQALLRALGRG
ncbi:hypothetical protein GCM10018781_50350 [Kitasatospora indigofera]|uniref:Uncharacterized protein n=1 Tax=Kitasatospora indigofera TaxID=67307 RepID=A0A919KZB8_9ACTN|nr:hypothetical protein [Kitasatospora indigofera]GHH77246.1 hypothetical protein GCM10018781_50350 [Kitasatospora indigofera]